jgi:putative chitinase
MAAPAFAVTAAQLKSAAPSGNAAIIDAIASGSGFLFAKYGITTRNRALGFLSVAIEETGGLTALVENLRYSAERLIQVWPSRFPNLAAAAPYADSPQLLANEVYGGRMGNSGTNSGWLYRGRGLIQITGHDNYALAAKLTGLALLSAPDLVASPEHALECALAIFTQYRDILDHCDKGEWSAVWALVGTGRPDGKVLNLAAHKAALARLTVAFPASPPPPDIPIAPASAPASSGLWPSIRKVFSWLMQPA